MTMRLAVAWVVVTGLVGSAVGCSSDETTGTGGAGAATSSSEEPTRRDLGTPARWL